MDDDIVPSIVHTSDFELPIPSYSDIRVWIGPYRTYSVLT